MNFRPVFLKSLGDFFAKKRVAVFLFFSLIVPFFFAGMMKEENLLNLSSMPLGMQAEMLGGFFVLFSFLWLAGVPLALLSVSTCSGFVAEEERDGTLLLLVSKPLNRADILVGKFLAFLANGCVLELAVLFGTCYIWASVLNLDFFVFSRLLGLVPWVFLYSLVVMLVFGSLSAALSSLSSNKTKIIVPMLVFVIVVFFGFSVFRGMAVQFGVYETYGLYLFDVGYELANVFVMFLSDYAGVRIMPLLQLSLSSFTGVYDTSTTFVDADQGTMQPSLALAGYQSPAASLLTWLLIPSVVFFLGLLALRYKEVN